MENSIYRYYDNNYFCVFYTYFYICKNRETDGSKLESLRISVSLTEQLSLWSGRWGRMKDLATRGPSHWSGLKAGFLQLVKIM